nr:MAG TPA: hypothetical protein [Caudoviricetes sp.]
MRVIIKPWAIHEGIRPQYHCTMDPLQNQEKEVNKE